MVTFSICLLNSVLESCIYKEYDLLMIDGNNTNKNINDVAIIFNENEFFLAFT